MTAVTTSPAIATRGSWSDGFVVAATGDQVVQVAFDDHVVWSVRPRRDGVRALGGWRLAWPATLTPYLRGSTRLSVRTFPDGETLLDAEVAFDDEPGRVAVADRFGHPLMVNKVGTLSRAIADAPEQIRQEILEASRAVLDVLRGPGGADAFLSYGALLGALRTGTMIGHDCDVDLAYLSRHDQPVDVILESYRLQRLMHERGWQTARMSAADFKVKVPLSDGRVELIDVFAAFHVGERFFQLGNHSGTLAREDVVPTSTVVLDGVEFAAPGRPEAMMTFLYGPTWRVPDPAFDYDDPPDGVRRLDGWLRGFRSDQPAWNRFYGSPQVGSVPRGPSDLATWAQARIDPAVPVADVGCGSGRDSRYFATHGHPVRSFDFSTDARVRTRKAFRRRGLPHDVRLLQLHELRTVLVEGLGIRGRVVHARGLLDCVDGAGRANFWRLAALAGGPVFLEFASGTGPRPRPWGLKRRLDADLVVAEAAAAGGRLVERVDGPGTDFLGSPDASTTRLHLDFSPEPR
ncbi:MAG: mucin-5AC [Nocardioidaceae bacterium]|nr:mucin-5AC [Nocardioidaceae bacterium]